MSAFPSKADIGQCGQYVRQVPITAIARPSAHIGNRLDLLESQLGTTMKLPRRTFLHLAAGAAALPAASRIARAQTYPTRSVRLIVGWPPGGAADLFARL